MRVLVRSYDLDDLGGSGVTLRAIARYLREPGDDVWAIAQPHDDAAIRDWRPDLIIAQQWATAEASAWATTLRLSFVLFVHGFGHYAGAADAEMRAVERGAGSWARDNVAWWRTRAGEIASSHMRET